jgi:type I restriction enzyme S subunit
LVESPDGWNPRQAPTDVFRYVDIEAVDNERQRIANARELRVVEAPSRARVSIEKGDVLFSLVRPYLKNIARVPEELHGHVASTAFVALRPKSGISTDFVFYQLLQDAFIKSIPTYGNSPPAARDEEFLNLEVPVAPSREQIRIANKLEELLSDVDAGAAALERAGGNLKRYRAAVLKAAVEGRLTEKWRAAHPNVEPASKLLERILAERRKRWEEAQLKKYSDKGQAPLKGWKQKYPEPVSPDIEGLPELPTGWCWASLDQLAEIVGGITKGQKRRQGQATRAVPYLRVANVQRGYLDLTEVKLIDATEDEILELRLVKGDVLFNEGGDRDKLGRGWVWEEQIPECIHQNHVFRARLVCPDVLPKFISIHGNTFGRSWFQQAGKQSVNLASINMGILKRFPVPLAPAKEQALAISLIEEQLSVLYRSTSILEQEEARSDRLRQAILKRAFEGKLVAQDPNDEPASELLARIRAAGAPAVKAKRREHRTGGAT